MDLANDPRDVGAANLEFARALVDELVASGVERAFVCPGSRSSPLALAVAEQAGLRCSVHVDERSAGFHALGYAKAAARPVVLICTSGTAAANFLPAVAEASLSRVPLLVLTADRPPELRAWGAPQTMEQRTLYAGFARWCEEAPCPSEDAGGRGYAGALARRAVRAATGPAAGPVHLNLPFREPLLPAGPEVTRPRQAAPRVDPPVRPPAPSGDAAIVASHLRSFARGVLVFGPEERDDSLGDAVRRTADALGWPVLADPASGLRAGLCCEGALVSSADLLLREPLAAEALRPDLIVRFGGVPTSAAIAGWLTRHASAQLWLVDPSDGLRDPQHRASRVWRLTATDFCRAAAESGAPSDAALQWRARWAQLDSVARSALDGALAAEPRFMTPHLARLLWERLPHEAVLYVANSMPIRDLDAFAGPRGPALTVLANRGVNGIDGLVSAALGAADASGRPTVLWCGDLALLHDVSGLLAGRLQGADLTVVVSNDDGGGIFEYLPAARAVPRAVFERFFAVSHGLDLCELARGLGWTANRVDTADALVAAVSASLEGGLHLIELTVDRAASTALHRRIHAAVAARLREAVER